MYEKKETMVNEKRRYIVATIKPWNEKLFEEKISKLPGVWKLVNDPDEFEFKIISEFNPWYIFFIHWSNKVHKEITDNFECVCFHMTDLPYGRGGSPLQNLIARGRTETVISAIRMVQEIDAGPVYYKRPLSLVGNAEEIFIRAGQIIAGMIHELIEKEPELLPQQGKIVIFNQRHPCESAIPEDANLEKTFDWIRMLDAQGYPPAFVTVGNLRIEFKRAAFRYDVVEADARITLVSKKK